MKTIYRYGCTIRYSSTLGPGGQHWEATIESPRGLSAHNDGWITAGMSNVEHEVLAWVDEVIQRWNDEVRDV